MVEPMTKPEMQTAHSYLYFSQGLAETGLIKNDRLSSFTERQAITLQLPDLKHTADPLEEMRRPEVAGVIIGLHQGWPGRKHLRLAREVLRGKRSMWLYWPAEAALERLDQERIDSYWRHWFAVQLYQKLRRFPAEAGETAGSLRTRYQEVERRLKETIEKSRPVPFNAAPRVSGGNRSGHTGAYLRTDFWAQIKSGGSYGHTCYVAKELAALADRFICFMPTRYALLDQLGLHQVVLPAPSTRGDEWEIVKATEHFYPMLKVAFETVRPAYIYERLCLGNFAGARLSQDLGIPYFVEYNGSEIQMRKSFDGQGYQYEAFYMRAEEAAFKQATVITVVSEHVKKDLMERGIDAAKILVNPNGADVDEYAPPAEDDKRALRGELGWDDRHRVIGFTGTFGGWHGIEILASAIPLVCQRIRDARFLLIGDGALKHLIDEQVERHGLAEQVRRTGWVPHKEGARLLKACDILVSPHHRHMNDSPFFGSPTKLFEYMAVGAGIVASDLEQIGEVLTPALRASRLGQAGEQISNERAVLCTPGDLSEFVEGVCFLAKRPDLCRTLGRNAREAVVQQYSWKVHVDRLWRFVGEPREVLGSAPEKARGSLVQRERPAVLVTGDPYKDQTQQQWNHDPCGSQYGKEGDKGTLKWFKDIEAHRYGDYAPWMPKVMEFSEHRGEQVLEVGGGLGTDLAQFAMNGAVVTDVDLSAGHLALAQQNFRLRGLPGQFIHQDAERLPFENDRFDLVYSNGVIHHTPNTELMVQEIFRVLKPGGKTIVMVYAENSLHYWGQQFYNLGLRKGLLRNQSMGEIMSGHVEMGEIGAKPLVKVYTKPRLRSLFRDFTDVVVFQRQLTPAELPHVLRWFPLDLLQRVMGWNLIIKARKPLNG